MVEKQVSQDVNKITFKRILHYKRFLLTLFPSCQPIITGTCDCLRFFGSRFKQPPET